MKPDLDEIDDKILALLMDNARLPVTSIAKLVGIARTTVIARISALEKRGVIAGYGLKLNQKLVQPAVRAYVGLSVEARYAAGLIKYLQQLPETETLCAVSGAIDYMLTLRCGNTDTLDKLLDQIGALDGVRQTSTSVILSKRIDRGAL
ncbi:MULTISPECIES: Lrp/AsnC family transcriptional regulator [Undibacterium]|jgi:DNA-binding Lrp family transcriptional regulator|uniref:Lrp/AsnC family transcriptional regulator n=1 Tax=Undibacterium umbellatum TaxID=2762300 RepID=A0ABR6Z4M3_9BURK|nr:MULTISPECIES: Lrp/AsnC family transcriptional regulator [Undibacterium]MBC3906271.1 Lrp/AsnC family transcriptional regulator [Undibacterium umbellatum]MDP1977992.1 Lrp/AsnC family transcriptional regulator [Undibacterium sp.]